MLYYRDNNQIVKKQGTGDSLYTGNVRALFYWRIAFMSGT
jgi:hypothetical protein